MFLAYIKDFDEICLEFMIRLNRQPLRHYIALITCLAVLLPLAAQHSGGSSVQCPMVKIEAERLPDLNIPRNGFTLLNVNGEPTAFGGRTTNFIPTPTIEYYKDGKWHVVPSAYTHDDGFAVQLTTGQVLVFGGHKDKLGIGQSFEAEFYDPVTHTCEGFASLDTKRAMATALALDDGRAVIAGNWHHEDAIEMYDGKNAFHHVKSTSVGRAYPFILRTAKDDAIFIGNQDTVGHHLSNPIVDRLCGEPFQVPLLEEWHLLPIELHSPTSYSFIGDESRGEYTYLLPLKNAQGQIAIARVANGEFSLLPTDVPVPMTSKWGSIFYFPTVYADRHAQRAYLLGVHPQAATTACDTSRLYVLIIDYAATPAHLTLGYTDVLKDFDPMQTTVDADGNLMMAGGIPTLNNFKPTAATWLIHVSPRAQAAGAGKFFRLLPPWGWVIIALAVAAMAAALALLSRRRRRKPADDDIIPAVVVEEPADVPDAPCEEKIQEAIQEATDTSMDYSELMRRICQLMDEQRLYLNPNLKITDIATILGTNRSTISACINSQRDCSFPQFVNTYRVARAQELLRNQADIKIAEVCLKAGFSNEASFYRIFKAITGTTPNAWKTR